jgi:hypothetical protein
MKEFSVLWKSHAYQANVKKEKKNILKVAQA